MTPWMDAIEKLRSRGYSMNLDGGKLRYAYRGKGSNPLQDEITPLLKVLKVHKKQILNDPYFLIEQTLEEINGAWQPGTQEWMKKSRPEDWRGMVALEEKINQMAVKGEVEGLNETLGQYEALILNMVGIFKTPKGETGDLFGQTVLNSDIFAH